MINTSPTIVKASGDHVPFDVERIAESCRRAGATPDVATAIARAAADRMREGTTTADIRAFVADALHRNYPTVAARYSLKEAMRRLGPAGYDFEKFIAEVLRAHGYATELPELLPGMCVMHEVDVVARLSAEASAKAGKNGVTAMIECKYRNGPGIYARLKDVMATWARYEDLRDAHAAGKCAVAFTEAWIVCNTKVTSDGIAFGECKGMRMFAWRQPANGGLERLIESQRCYPATILRSVDARVEQRLAAAGLMLVRDLAAMTAAAIATRVGIPPAVAGALHDEAIALLA